MEKTLFQETRINRMVLKNRLMMAAMHLGYAQKGHISNREYEFYRARAKGGVGSIVTVCKVNALAGPGDMASIESDEYMPGIKKLVEIVNEDSCRLVVQLFHCGRNSTATLGKNENQDPLAPSRIPSPLYKTIPQEMTISDIESTIEDFASAALRCKQSGVDAVEISCSAGYLLTQFLSPLTNTRTDQFGGSEENRRRFPRRVIEKIREYVGNDYPVILRISGSQMMSGGYGIEEMQRFCQGLKPGWVDAISVTGGWHEAPVPQITIQVPEGGYAYLSGAIKRVVDVPVISCNRIHSLASSQKILDSGLADYAASARAYLADPEFVNKSRLGQSYNPCQACNRGCIEPVLRGGRATCAFNPTVGREVEEQLEVKSELAKRIMVIGGGPAGMEAAKRAAQKGNRVVLYTSDSQLGGQLAVAKLPPEKEKLQDFVDSLKEELLELGVDIQYNTEVDGVLIEKAQPEKVIVATGSKPIIPKINGINSSHVLLAEKALKGSGALLSHLRKGKTVIIGGGSVGLEVAHHLGMKVFLDEKSFHFLTRFVSEELKSQMIFPLDLTVIEMSKKVGKGLGGTKWILLRELKELGVKISTNTKVVSIAKNTIEVEMNQEKQVLTADNVILAMGYQPQGAELIAFLENSTFDYTIVGDAEKPADVMKALVSAYQNV